MRDAMSPGMTRDDRPVAYDPATGRYDGANDAVALSGQYRVSTTAGTIDCRTVFDHYAALCRRYSPEVVEATCWIPQAQLEEAARLIWHARPVSYYAWSGHEQHANTTETARAMALLYALTGSFDAPGGNVLLPAIAAAPITGEDLPAARRMPPAIGVAERPLGPSRWNSVSTHGFLSRGARGRALPGAWPDRVRREPAAGAGRSAIAVAPRCRRWNSTPMPICS